MNIRLLALSWAALAAAAPLAAAAQTTTSTTVNTPAATVTHSSTSQTTSKHSETVEPARLAVRRTHRMRHHRRPVAAYNTAVEKTTTVAPGAVSTTVKSMDTSKK